MTETEPGESGDNYRVESGGVHRGSRVGSAAVVSPDCHTVVHRVTVMTVIRTVNTGSWTNER